MKHAILTIALFSGLFLVPKPSSADPVRDYLGRVAEDLARFLKSQNESSVAVVFNGPPQIKSSAANALTQIVSDILKKKGIRVELGTKFGFEGTFKPDEQAPDDFFPGVNPKKIGVALNGKIVDAFGNSPVDIDFVGFVSDERKLFELLGTTVDLDRKADEQRGPAIKSALLNPAFFTKNNLAQASEDSRFALGVEVGGELLPIDAENKFPFVDLKLGDTYKVRLVNNAPFEVAVAVAVDGLSVFHFSELRSREIGHQGEPAYRYWTVPSAVSFSVPGWHKRDSVTVNGVNVPGSINKFTTAPLEEAAAFKLGRVDDIGTITATFMACWEEGKTNPPDDEVPVRAMVAVNDPKTQVVELADGTKVQSVQVAGRFELGTKLGEEEKLDVRGAKRVFGRPRATVTIRYNRGGAEK